MNVNVLAAATAAAFRAAFPGQVPSLRWIDDAANENRISPASRNLYYREVLRLLRETAQ